MKDTRYMKLVRFASPTHISSSIIDKMKPPRLSSICRGGRDGEITELNSTAGISTVVKGSGACAKSELRMLLNIES
jgi:hypothetical protein